MKIKIFIAGSTELKDEMDLFRSVANKLSVENDYKGIDIVFLAVTCTDFPLLFHDGGQQEIYNSFIENQSNLVFFIFDSKVGIESMKELKLAYKCRNIMMRPDIQVFIKNNKDKNKVIETLSQYIKGTINQYVTIYNNNESLIKEIEQTLRSYIEPYSKDSSKLINQNELWGKVFMAQQSLSSQPPKYDLALKIFKDLVVKNINNWRFYFSIGIYCARVKYKRDFTKVALDAYENARRCTFKENEAIDESKINIYIGAMKRRLGNLKGAIEDITQGYEMALDIQDSHKVRLNAMRNFYKVYYMDRNIGMLDWVRSEMKKLIDNDNIIHDITHEWEEQIEKDSKVILPQNTFV